MPRRRIKLLNSTQGYNPSEIILIRNGIARLRADLGVLPSARLVPRSSRLNQMKGIRYFLQAAARLSLLERYVSETQLLYQRLLARGGRP